MIFVEQKVLNGGLNLEFSNLSFQYLNVTKWSLLNTDEHYLLLQSLSLGNGIVLVVAAIV